MVLLDHLYAQDPRSTKAFTQMDLGRFSLLSWDTYSNNIPWMFPEDGMASHLRASASACGYLPSRRAAS